MRKPPLWTPDDLRLPVILGLTGTLLAICYGMTHFPSDVHHTRVALEESIPIAGFGGIVGAVFGGLVERFVRARPRATSLVFVIEVELVCASICAPIGWFVKDIRVDHWGLETMLKAAVVGLCLGLVLNVVAWIFRRRRRNNAGNDPNNTPHVQAVADAE